MIVNQYFKQITEFKLFCILLKIFIVFYLYNIKYKYICTSYLLVLINTNSFNYTFKTLNYEPTSGEQKQLIP